MYIFFRVILNYLIQFKYLNIEIYYNYYLLEKKIILNII